MSCPDSNKMSDITIGGSRGARGANPPPPPPPSKLINIFKYHFFMSFNMVSFTFFSPFVCLFLLVTTEVGYKCMRTLHPWSYPITNIKKKQLFGKTTKCVGVPPPPPPSSPQKNPGSAPDNNGTELTES